MKRRIISAAAIWTAVSVTSAHAQTAVGVGTGVSSSKSQSASQAVAIGGGNAQGGNGGNAASTVNIAGTPAQTATTSTIAQTVSGTQTLRNVPTVFSPGLSSAGLETCLGSFSIGAGWLGAGLSGGSTMTDEGCAARLDARTLWSFGLHKAALARLCMRPDIYRSLPECVQYLPQQTGYAGAAYNPAGPPPVVMQVSAEEQAEIDKAYVPGTPINLIDGKTGKERVCYDYDVAHHKCKPHAWAKN